MTAQNYLDRADYIQSLKDDDLVGFTKELVDNANYKIKLNFPGAANIYNLYISCYQDSKIDKKYVDLTKTF